MKYTSSIPLKKYLKHTIVWTTIAFTMYFIVGSRTQTESWTEYFFRTFLFSVGTTVTIVALVYFYREQFYPSNQRRIIAHKHLEPLRTLGLVPVEGGRQLSGYINGYYTIVYWDDDNRIKKGSIDKPTLRFEIDFREDKRGQEIVSKLPVIWHLGYVSYDLECGMRRPPSAERILSTMTDLSEILQQNHLSPIRRDEWEKLWIPEYERLHKETNHKSIKKSYRILGMKIDVLDRPDSGAA